MHLSNGGDDVDDSRRHVHTHTYTYTFIYIYENVTARGLPTTLRVTTPEGRRRRRTNGCAHRFVTISIVSYIIQGDFYFVIKHLFLGRSVYHVRILPNNSVLKSTVNYFWHPYFSIFPRQISLKKRQIHVQKR